MLAIATWMRWAQLLTEPSWLEVVRITVGGYLAANVGQKAVEGLAQVLGAKAPAAAQTATVPSTRETN